MTESYRSEANHYSLYTRVAAHHVFSILSALSGGGKALDAGFGTGYFLKRIDETWPGKWELHGVECDQKAVDWTRRRVQGKFDLGSVTDLPYPDETFDLVLSVSVLEHIEDDARAIGQLVRVLKPNGTLIVSVPCLDGSRSHSTLRNLGHTDPLSPEYHVRLGYHADALTRTLEREGLTLRSHWHGMFLLSELLMDLAKWAYFRSSNTLDSQTNIGKSKTSLAFSIYRLLFPLVYCIELGERGLFGGSEKGHIFTAAFRKSL